MLELKITRNNNGDISGIETSLVGNDLLSTPKLNKGCAFSREEREELKLVGLLPHQIETLEQQVARMHAQYHEHRSNMGKNIYLNVLHDYNETLFYKLVSEHLEEMLPIIYTPTIGEAVERFSMEHRKTRGQYISYPDRDQIEAILENRLPDQVDLIVVTDGEAILGIGDQGIGGINISSAKLMVYTLCAGINPHRVLPIQLDVGTNNKNLLADPMYLGWRHERISGKEYDDFIERFVSAVRKKFPHIFLHWEDIGRDNARQILDRYRDEICTFNDDMQGTGVVTLACILAGVNASGTPLTDQRVIIFGAGTAGVGIADQICDAMQRFGLSKEEAHARFWLLDKEGLLTDQSQLMPFQQPYAKSHQDIASWKLRDKKHIGLFDVVSHVKPTILIGCSTVAGAFSEEIIKIMAAHVKHPIIMPLSNPTEKAEAKPEDLLNWTQGNALIATGSPFHDVIFQGQQIRIAQSNNAFAFPGIGLGTIAMQAKHVSDDMLWVATETLSRCSPINTNKSAPLLPKLADAKAVSYQVALAVAEQARKEGLAQIDDKISIEQAIKRVIWEPRYYPYRKI
ncbi:MAG: NAD-dependent malic enzyme [Gammaproteobacteria bacterium]|nr:NAD-dependent malic enzyme [Gammaproteobacteria bacterium]